MTAVQAAAERLAARLSLRDASRVDLTACADTVPTWWQRGVARAAVFGEGLMGGVEVLPRAEVSIEDGGRFLTTFSLTHGRVGRLALDYVVDASAGALVEMTTKAYCTGDDRLASMKLLG